MKLRKRLFIVRHKERKHFHFKKRIRLEYETNSNQDWENEWQGMPEFIQNDQSPFKTIIIKFQNINDMNDFMKIIKQKFTIKTKSLWFPKLDLCPPRYFRYINES